MPLTHPVIDCDPAPSGGKSGWVAAVVLLALLAGVWLGGLERWLDLDLLAAHRAELMAFVTAHAAGAVILYIAVYAVAVAVSVPGATVLTLAGGLLFGTVGGTACAVVGATVGACAVFLAARSVAGDRLRRKAGGAAARLADAFVRDAFSYMLFLRLVPLFPFWLVNIVPAVLGVRLAPYALSTLIGIVPGAAVYAALGQGMGEVIAAGGAVTAQNVLTMDILLPMLGLGVLALLPLAVRYWRNGLRRAP